VVDAIGGTDRVLEDVFDATFARRADLASGLSALATINALCHVDKQ
jgi:hypothetical protein